MIAPPILLSVAAGACAGTIHFAAIAREADLLVKGGSALASSGLRLGRLVLTILVLTLAARQGWLILLGAGAGFMAARQLVLRRMGAAA